MIKQQASRVIVAGALGALSLEVGLDASARSASFCHARYALAAESTAAKIWRNGSEPRLLIQTIRKQTPLIANIAVHIRSHWSGGDLIGLGVSWIVSESVASIT